MACARTHACRSRGASPPSQGGPPKKKGDQFQVESRKSEFLTETERGQGPPREPMVPGCPALRQHFILDKGFFFEERFIE